MVNPATGVDSGMSVAAGDRIATEVEEELLNKIEFLRRVYVHYHPVGSNGAE